MKIGALILMLIIPPTFAGTLVAPSIVTDDELRRMLVTRIDVQKSGTGIVVGILKPDSKHIYSYGTMGTGDRRPVNGNTVFDIGSLTKVFTALILSDMVVHRELSLDDPVAKYLPPDVHLPSRGGKQITLADLATHTSGLPLRPTNLASKDPNNKYTGYSTDLLYQFLSTYAPKYDIGSHYEYSNVGFGVLGQALSRRAGRPYAELVHSLITKPLGMNDTRLSWTIGMRERSALGYNADLMPVEHEDSGALVGSGDLKSTANDLLKFLEACLGYRGSTFLPAMNVMLNTRRSGGMEPSTQIGLAWNIYLNDSHEIVWKNGSESGFRAFVGYNPTARLGVVALINAQTPEGADDIGLHILDPSIRVDMHVPRVHKEVAINPALLDRYVGRYQFSPADIMIITRDGNHLFIAQEQAPDQGKFEMFAEGDRDFFLKVADAQCTFESLGDGPATSAIWHQAGQDQRAVRIK